MRHRLTVVVTATAPARRGHDRESVAPNIGRRSLLFAAVSVAGLWVPLQRSIAEIDSQAPLALVGWAMPLAIAVALHGIRSEPDPTEARPERAADAFIAGCCFAIGLLCAFAAPRAFGWDSTAARPELLAAPGLLAGWIVVFFGSRALWLARRGIAVAVAACPIWYGWLVEPLQRAGIAVAWPALQALGSVAGVRTTDAAGLNAVGFADGTMVVVGATCAGASSVLGVGLVLGSTSCVLRGTTRQKTAWVLAGAAIALVGNIVRLCVLLLVGVMTSPSAALRFVHPVAGVIVTLGATAVSLALSPRFGLEVPRRPVHRVDDRLARCAPRHITVATAVAIAVAASANVAYASIWQLDRLGGSSAVANDDAALVLPQVAGALGLDSTEIAPVSWVEQFYGQATWRRFVMFDPDAPGRAPITVDLTTAAEADAIDRLDLAACYGFHGVQVEHEIGVDGMGDRPAERFAFDEPDERGGRTGSTGRTEVVTWQTKVPGGVQRVVVSQLAGDRQAVAELAAAISAATVSAATSGTGGNP